MRAGVRACVAACMFVAASSAWGAATDLSFRVKPGEELRYKFTMEQKIKTMGTGAPETESLAIINYVLAVRPKRSGARGNEVELQLVQYAFDNSEGGTKATYDSSKMPQDDGQRAIGVQFAPIKKVKLTARIEPDGTVTNLLGLFGLPNSALGQRLSAEFFSKESVQRNLGPMFGVRVAGAREVGAEWESSDPIIIGPGHRASAANEHTLKKVEANLATIEIESFVTFPEMPVHQGMSMKPSQGKLSGTQVWDVAEGRLESFNGRQHMVIDVIGEGVAMRRAVDVKVTIRRMDEESGVPVAPAK